MTIRCIVLDRIIKDPKVFRITNDKNNKCQLLTMRNNKVLPYWQVLLAFAVEYGLTVRVYQDGLGVVNFPGPVARVSSMHLHSLASVHFNLILKEDISTLLNATMEGTENSDQILYMLQQDDETPLVVKCKPIKCKKKNDC